MILDLFYCFFSWKRGEEIQCVTANTTKVDFQNAIKHPNWGLNLILVHWISFPVFDYSIGKNYIRELFTELLVLFRAQPLRRRVRCIADVSRVLDALHLDAVSCPCPNIASRWCMWRGPLCRLLFVVFHYLILNNRHHILYLHALSFTISCFFASKYSFTILSRSCLPILCWWGGGYCYTPSVM